MLPFLLADFAGTAAILGGALALGIRHGIDWDHIAAITDITSASAATVDRREAALGREPGVMLTDESTHRLTAAFAGALPAGGQATNEAEPGPGARRSGTFWRTQRQPLYLGSMYALGHGSMVIVLGLAAILFSEILPDWLDPIMESVVGVTLILLSLYLFYSLYRFFRGGGEFRIQSRWMLVFSLVRNGFHRLTHRARGTAGHGHDHHEHASPDSLQYGPRTAYGIGLIHGIGAETGTQVLIIGAAVGAGSRTMGIATLFVFVIGILIANSIVTVVTTAGFVSANKRQVIYVVVGAFAAVFSLVVGVVFLAQVGDSLPNLDRFVSWLGGPS